MKNWIIILLIFSSVRGFSQIDTIRPDSIEYCWWLQIFQFKLSNNKYYFSEFNDNSIVETDSLIFEPTTYFGNFITKPDYVDSVRFAIVSRTLKFYHEPILYNTTNPYIRIVWLKYKTPILLTLSFNNDSVQLIYKECNGSCDIHGEIINQKCAKFSSDIFTTSFEILNKSDFFNLKHGLTFCHKDTIPLNQPCFFMESKNGKSYNVVNVNECNLDFDRYKYLNGVLKYIFKKAKKN